VLHPASIIISNPIIREYSPLFTYFNGRAEFATEIGNFLLYFIALFRPVGYNDIPVLENSIKSASVSQKPTSTSKGEIKNRLIRQDSRPTPRD
jgi:hypothetical protein